MNKIKIRCYITKKEKKQVLMFKFRKTILYNTYSFCIQVINDWKKAFTEMVRKENEITGKWKSNMLAFSTTSFKEKVEDFSTTLNQDSTYAGLILLVRS